MLTSVKLVALAAAALSLVFSYFPSLNTWYAAKDESTKKLIQLGWLALVTLAIFGIGCAPELASRIGSLFTPMECTTEGAYDLLFLFAEAVTVNQATYLISPTHPAVAKQKQLSARMNAVTRG